MTTQLPDDPMPTPEVRRHPMTGELCAYLEFTFPGAAGMGPMSIGRYMSSVEAHRLATQLVELTTQVSDANRQ